MELKTLNNYALLEMVDHIPHYIFWKDCNLIFRGCNKAFASQFGFKDTSEVIGKTDGDFPWSEELKSKYLKDDMEIIRTGKAKLDYEESQKQPDGSIKTVLVSKVPFHDESNEIAGVLGVYTDITERKQQEKAILLAKESAEISNRLKNDFIKNMEHDIRTPVAGIYGIAGILASQENDPITQEYLNLLLNASKELLDYCNSLLNFSKLESGLVPMLSKKFNLKKLIERIVAIETPSARIKNLQIITEYEEGIPTIVLSDQYRLQRILINLISNSVKFTNEGFIKIVTKFITKKDDRNIVLRITIEDTGIGIPKDKQDVIYEKFIRLHPSNQGIYKGFGLGLPIVKQLMEELEGEVELKSELGKGTIFALSIPFKLPLVDDIIFEENDLN